MSERWEFFFRDADGKPASIFVNTSLGADPPKQSHPHVGTVQLRMRTPGDRGLSSQQEFDTLVAIENALGKFLCAGPWTIFVGRVTKAGRRDFYFYLNDPSGWEERAADAMRLFPDYSFECGAWADKDWSIFYKVLCPTEAELVRMRDLAVCAELENHGDELTEPREIDHWAYFPSPEVRSQFIERCRRLGLKVRNTSDPNPHSKSYGVQLFQVDIPGRDRIEEITAPLRALAEELGGEYDGWETQIVQSSQPHAGIFGRLWPKTKH